MIAKSGDVSLFLVDFWTRFTALGGELMSGSPQTKDFTPNLTGAESVGALQHMIDSTKFAASGVTQYDFTASVDAFAAGKTAMMLMWATIGGTVFDPAYLEGRRHDRRRRADGRQARARRLRHRASRRTPRTRTPPGPC